MRKIGIVGAGPSGLQLALGLLGCGYEVVLHAAQSADQVLRGRVTSSQCMFAKACQHERDLGLAHWDTECPPIDGIRFNLAEPPGELALTWGSRLSGAARSVDQRLKLSRWLGDFESEGGDLRLGEARHETLESLSRECDLVVVSAGKGEISGLFERDERHSPFRRPMRALGVLYVNGATPRPDYSAVSFNLMPGLGEFFTFPALTVTGPCDIMVFEGLPGGPLDCWDAGAPPEQQLETALQLLQRHLPWEFERFRDARLTDRNGLLFGAFAPVVRRPVGVLPSGRRVLGMADAVCLNDPILGQGANSASKCASLYLREIVGRGQAAFDPAWMQATFDLYWDYARHVTEWSNAMLLPAPPHVQAMLAMAASRPNVAQRLVDGFDNPPAVSRFFLQADYAARLMEDAR